MAVPKSKRTESPLEVLNEARTLAVYTIRLCSDENKIPKRYRWCIASELINAAVKASSYCARANAIYVNDLESYKLRRAYQQRALAELESLESSMIIAYELFSGLKQMKDDDRPKGRINISAWTSQKIKVKNLVLSWKKSDTERFKKMGRPL